MVSRRRPLKLPGPDEKGPAYEVGYGKPPEDTRFKPGQSGNSHGRPKGAKNRSNRIPALNEERMRTVILEEAYRMIGVSDGDRRVEIPVIQAIIRGVALNAAKGNQRAQRMFADLLQWVERENKALYDEWLKTAIEYKTWWERELYRREQHGVAGPEPVPHPDDIVINMHTGLVEVRGPMTEEEKRIWDWVRESETECEETIADLEKRAAEDRDNRAIRKQLRQERKRRPVFTKIKAQLGMPRKFT